MTHLGEINGQTDLKICLEKKTRSANTLKEIDLGQTRQSRQSRQTRLIRVNKINPADERNSKPDIKPTGKYRRKIRFLCIIPGI